MVCRPEHGVSSMDTQFLCSVPDAAKMLGIGRTKIYEMLTKGELVSMQIGTRRLVRIDSIKTLIERATGGAA
ncbi:helix-turn-helix domain-containing protein [Parasphingorhabdus sp.]|uniref:helix-turn-helix domain-containing protein n=1 Tax=Parasphingorhabdus sp. TaxID=2709688 RepID=UPI0035943F85